ncbi:hypothetical protein ACK3TF_004479 [Chlorella vulgaris]
MRCSFIVFSSFDSPGCHALPRRKDVPPAAEDSEAAQFDGMGFAAKVIRIVAAYPFEYSWMTFNAVFTLFFGYMVGAGWSMFAVVGVPPLIVQTYVFWDEMVEPPHYSAGKRSCHALPRRQDVFPAAKDLEAAQFDAMGFAAKVIRIVAAYPFEYSCMTFIAVFTWFFGYMVGAGWSMFAVVGVPLPIVQTYVFWNDFD